MIKLSLILTDQIKILPLTFLNFQTTIKLIIIHNILWQTFYPLLLQSPISNLLLKILIIINIFLLIVTWLLILNLINFFDPTIATSRVFQLIMLLPIRTSHISLFIPVIQF